MYIRNQFPEIISAAYHYSLQQTKDFLKKPLESIDKSTPHRDTNHAVLVILLVQGKRIAMPLDAPPVYRVAETTADIEGGTGQDLAKQVVTVVKEKLDFEQQDMHYIRGTILSNH